MTEARTPQGNKAELPNGFATWMGELNLARLGSDAPEATESARDAGRDYRPCCSAAWGGHVPERCIDAMYQEDVIEKALAILASPLPTVTASRDNDRARLIDAAVRVLSGEMHPHDAIVPKVAAIQDQVNDTFGVSK